MNKEKFFRLPKETRVNVILFSDEALPLRIDLTHYNFRLRSKSGFKTRNVYLRKPPNELKEKLKGFSWVYFLPDVNEMHFPVYATEVEVFNDDQWFEDIYLKGV